MAIDYGKLRLALALLACLLPAIAWPRSQWHECPERWPAGCYAIDSIAPGQELQQVLVRFAPADARQCASWTLYCCGLSATVETPQLVSEFYDCFFTITVRDASGAVIDSDRLAYDGGPISIKVVRDAISWRVYGGTKVQKAIGQPVAASALPSQGSISLEASAPLDCHLIYTDLLSVPAPQMYAGNDIYAIAANSSDPIVGIWQYLDRDTPRDKASLGGRYTIAIVPTAAIRHSGENADDAIGPDADYGVPAVRNSSHPDYIIVYLSGAEVNPSAWPAMRIKGWLSPTPFAGHFDLAWLDAHGRPTAYKGPITSVSAAQAPLPGIEASVSGVASPVSGVEVIGHSVADQQAVPMTAEDSYAQLSADGSILTLYFPLYKSQLRFFHASPK